YYHATSFANASSSPAQDPTQSPKTRAKLFREKSVKKKKRHALLDMARAVQWFFIDKIVLGTRIAVQCLGPLLTLCFIQARGWPFVVAVWGFLDLLLLEGKGQFEQHWLYFLPQVGLYSAKGGDDSGSYILNSELYVRLLLSMLLAGAAFAAKRTAVAMYFGRRTFVEFKPRLEKLLKEVVLVSEVAALADEAEIIASEEEEDIVVEMRAPQPRKVPGGLDRPDTVKVIGGVSWKGNKSTRSRAKSEGNLPASPSMIVDVSDGDKNNDDDSGSDDDDNESGSDDEDEEDGESEFNTQKNSAVRPLLKSSSINSRRALLNLLEHWEEPVNKADKSLNASISDILRFRRALTFMDDKFPFGEAFGPAGTREQVVASSANVFARLLKLTPGQDKVSCEFCEMLALEDDEETINISKRKALSRLFRPDAQNELSLVAFVKSCDSMYKKLRYFRANVGNASVIDHALEKIVDAAFSFALIASKWFEGMLLVAARRPFDLGDRIYMTDPSLINSDGLWYCWFVEDINLFHTTVRYAGTNEVATINNGSVANMRIINGARSPNALVWWQFPYRPNLMEDNNIDRIKAALEQYASDNPRNWHSFSYFRVDEVHPGKEKLVVTVGMYHRSSWQDLVTILEAKSACMCWLLEYGRQLGVNWDELPRRDLLYYAGQLKQGGVKTHRFQLHDPSNITAATLPPPMNEDRPTPLAFTSTKSQDDSIFQKKNENDDLSENAKFLEQLQHSQSR
ncbi:MAG: hypothetical protein SGILL_004884, partial [Bacillariaceae sp.]